MSEKNLSLDLLGPGVGEKGLNVMNCNCFVFDLSCICKWDLIFLKIENVNILNVVALKQKFLLIRMREVGKV